MEKAALGGVSYSASGKGRSRYLARPVHVSWTLDKGEKGGSEKRKCMSASPMRSWRRTQSGARYTCDTRSSFANMNLSYILHKPRPPHLREIHLRCIIASKTSLSSSPLIQHTPQRCCTTEQKRVLHSFPPPFSIDCKRPQTIFTTFACPIMLPVNYLPPATLQHWTPCITLHPRAPAKPLHECTSYSSLPSARSRPLALSRTA